MSHTGCFSWFSCFRINQTRQGAEVEIEDNNNDKMMGAGRKKSMGQKLEHPDDTFDLLDMDESGTLERGDIEILLNLWGITDVDAIAMYTSSIMKLAGHDERGKINRDEWNQEWSSIKRLLDSIRLGSVGAKRGVMSLKKTMDMSVQSLPLYAFGNKLSFFRRPIYPDHRPTADLVFFGSPYDSATTFRMGARFGPQAVRQQSQTVAFNYSPDHDRDYSGLRIYDAGDAVADPFNIMLAMNQTYLFAKKLWNTSERVIGVGGDHSLSWCMLRAARDHVGGPVALINLDAHYDTVDVYCGNRLTHGTSLRRAMEDGCIDMKRAFHVGLRGSVSNKDIIQEDKAQGWTSFSMDSFVEQGPVEVARRIRKQIGDAPTLVSVDMDVLDPAECPGVGYIEAGGMTTRELLRFLRALRGLNVIGGEVVELSPEYDRSNVSAQVAANSAYEVMCLALNNVNS